MNMFHYLLLSVLLLSLHCSTITTVHALLRGNNEDDDIINNNRKLFLSSIPNLPNFFNDRWIIYYKEGSQPSLPDFLNFDLFDYVFDQLLNVAIVSGIPKDVIQLLLNYDNILFIEQDQPVYIVQQQERQQTDSTSTTITEIVSTEDKQSEDKDENNDQTDDTDDNNDDTDNDDEEETTTIQQLKSGELWNLDRIDTIELSYDDKYEYKYTGKGVQVYSFDTGIQSNHDEFQNNDVICGLNLVDNEDCDDMKGHGTHTAAIIGGKTYGVAKDVSIITIKILDKDGKGSASGVIRGLEYVMDEKIKNPQQPMIVNLSLGSAISLSLNEAVNRAVNNGIVVIIAAGNEGIDSCTTSPASAEKGIVVAATDQNDTRPNWSNYGSCVNINAPGSDILSAAMDKRDKKKKVVKTGSSMAAPHVAGVAAMLLEWDSTLTPDEVYQYIWDESSISTESGFLGSPNRIVNIAGIRNFIPITPKPQPPPIDNLLNGGENDNNPQPDPEPFTGITQTCGIILINMCQQNTDCCFAKCRNLGIFGSRCWFW